MDENIYISCQKNLVDSGFRVVKRDILRYNTNQEENYEICFFGWLLLV